MKYISRLPIHTNNKELKHYIKNLLPILIAFIGIGLNYSSCVGQQNSTSTKSFGKIVTEIDSTIWSIHHDLQGNYWFGSKNHGMFLYDGESLVKYTSEDGLVDDEIRGIQEDSTGTLYFETVAGVSKFDGKSFQTLEIADSPSKLSEWNLEPTDLWFHLGFVGKGPYRYDGEFLHKLKLPTSPQERNFYLQHPGISFSPYGMYTIYRDNHGFMWFGTASLGACRYDGSNFSWHYEDQLQTTPSGGDFGMRAILQDKDGHYWFNNPQYRYEIPVDQAEDSNHLTFRKLKGVSTKNADDQEASPFFLSISEDDAGNLWMLTYSDGVWKKTGEEFTHYPVTSAGENILLFKIYKDRQGVLWLGTHNDGVYKFNGKTFEKFEG